MNRLAAHDAVRLPRIIEAPESLPPARSLGLLRVAAGRAVLPLASVEVRAKVAARAASVSLVQTFRNAGDDALEAIYVFPLPGGAAIASLEMAVGERVIRAQIQEKQQAREKHERAVETGHRSALLEQERDGVFTMSVGNIAPGEKVAVRLSYVERLASFDDGRVELRLPLVVAPRYIPGALVDRVDSGQGVENDTDTVPDASRISPPRLAAGLDPDVALSVEVEIAGGGDPVDDLECSQHATRLSGGAFGIRVALAREGERLDRDFVLRWHAAPESAQASLLCARGPDGARYGVLSVAAPRDSNAKAAARDVVVLLDVSGSMEGAKIASAARAASFLLETLGAEDRFEVILFESSTRCMNGSLLAADQAGLERAGRFLREARLGGGTELDPALERALSVIHGRGFAAEARQGVIVVITDGQVGDEERIVARAKKGLRRSRLFAVGIDTAVNGAFLERLAKIGGGRAALVEPGSKVEDALRGFAREIGAPFATEIALEDEGAGIDAASLAPERVPDLFAGRASTAFVRLSAGGAGKRVRVRGNLASGGALDLRAEAKEIDLPGLSLLWAKARAQDLEDRARLAAPKERAAIEKQIVAVALAHGLVTPFTSLVAVDAAEVVKGAMGRRTMVQPVETPASWQGESAAARTVPVPCPAPAAPPGFPSIPGFTVTKTLGEGGMGVVYKGIAGPPPADAAPEEAPRGKKTGFFRGLFESAAPVVNEPSPPYETQTMKMPPAGFRPSGAPPASAAPAGAPAAAPVYRPPVNGIFGIPRVAGAGGPALTAAGMTLGTVAYFAPEQLMGRDLDASADVYSFGVVLYELVTGRLPFQHDNEMMLMKMIMKDPPPLPSAVQPGLPGAVDTVLLRALEKDRARRYRTAAELAQALEELRATLPAPEGPAPRSRRGAAARTALPEGVPARVGGRYTLLAPAGQSGAGDAFEARDEQTGAEVLLIRVYANLVKADTLRERIIRAAAEGSRVAHEGLGAVLGAVEAPEGVFIVVERVEGEPLDEVLTREGALDPVHAIDLVLPALAGLGALHAAGVLHRSISSADLVLTAAGRVKLMPAGVEALRGPDAAPVVHVALSVPPAAPASPPTEGQRSLWKRVVGAIKGGGGKG